MTTASSPNPVVELSPELAQARAQVSLSAATSASLAGASGLLVLAASEGKDAPALLAAPGCDATALAAALAELGYTARTDEILRLPGSVAGWNGTILVVGLGKGLEWAADATRDAAILGDTREGVLARAARAAAHALAGEEAATFALGVASLAELRAVAAGVASGAYAWSGKRPAAKTPLAAATVVADIEGEEVEEAAIAAALTYGSVLGGSLRLVRDLVNEPPNRLYPATFAQIASEAAAAEGLEVEILDDAALTSQGFGGIIGVGQGSVHPPRLVRVSWVPDGEAPRVSLIGKGITFDSGGLSLKPAPSMPEMKSDMAGAATVLGAVIAAARLQLPVRVDAWLALAENLPSMDAQRPSDIVTMYGGTTVEITNTDAEGRLVMADALARAAEDAPDAILDIATLTGAQLVALGERVSGVMGTPEVRDAVANAAVRAQEAFWPMPLPEHLRSKLDSPYAQLANANMGSRWGGMLTAGLFLREFVGEIPWAHLDVAGPAFNDGGVWGGVPTGGTGAGLATLVEFLASFEAEECCGSAAGGCCCDCESK